MYRKNAVTAGMLILISLTAAYSTTGLVPMLYAAGKSAALNSYHFKAQLSLLGSFLDGLVCAGIGAALYPALRKRNPGLAMGTVVFHGIEGVMRLLSTVALVSMLSLMQSAAGLDDVGTAMQGLLGASTALVFAGLCCGGIGGLLACLALYRQKSIPSWLALWGLITMALHLLSGVLAFLGFYSLQSLQARAIHILASVQQLAFALWLIVKGFLQREQPKEVIEMPR